MIMVQWLSAVQLSIDFKMNISFGLASWDATRGYYDCNRYLLCRRDFKLKEASWWWWWPMINLQCFVNMLEREPRLHQLPRKLSEPLIWLCCLVVDLECLFWNLWTGACVASRTSLGFNGYICPPGQCRCLIILLSSSSRVAKSSNASIELSL